MNSETIVSLLTLVGLIAMMLSMGLKVDFNDVAASMRQPRLIGLGLLANFVLVPAVTILLLRGFDASASVSAGFLILAVCPGAPVGPPFAAVAKGDVAFATGLMVVLAGLSAVLSPLLLRLLLNQLLPVTEVRVDYFAIVRTLLIAQILPLGVGLSLRRWMPIVAERISKPISLTANVLLLIVVAILLSREYATLSMIQGRGWTGMLLLLAADPIETLENRWP
jgi:BASS family bile acid:Na+ symporter